MKRGHEDHAAEACRYLVMAYHEHIPDVAPETPRVDPSKRDQLYDKLIKSIEEGDRDGTSIEGLGGGW